MTIQAADSQSMALVDFARVRTTVNAALTRGELDDAKRIVRNAASSARQLGDLSLERRFCSLFAYIALSRGSLM